MPKTLIIPGFNGSSDKHWQRIWAGERQDSVIVEQQNWSCPVLSDWQEKLDEALSVTESAFLVAHSLGCLLAASYARRRFTHKIRGALLVAPCALDTAITMHPCLAGFGAEPLSELPFPNILVASSNDPYMSGSQAQRYALCWGSEVLTIGAVGHINVDSGFGRWSAGYDLLDKMVQRARPSRSLVVNETRGFSQSYSATVGRSS